MRLISLLGCLLLTTAIAADDWTPPANPDPTTILSGIRVDVQAKEYEVALAKHVWYHENALAIEPAQSGVRLSFALTYWLDLAKVYPPAMERLRDVRDETENRIRNENRTTDYFDDFHDLTALNRTLSQQEQTVAVFRWLSERNEDEAGKVFGVSRPALIAAGEYELCGKFLDVDRDVARIKRSYQMNLKSAEKFGPQHLDYTNKSLIKDSATLVGLLVLNERKKEAEAVSEKLKGYPEDPGVSERLARALDAALEGNIPTR